MHCERPKSSDWDWVSASSGFVAGVSSRPRLVWRVTAADSESRCLRFAYSRQRTMRLGWGRKGNEETGYGLLVG